MRRASSHRRRRGAPRRPGPRVVAFALGAVVAGGVPFVASAQADSAVRVHVIRASTPFEQQVERMARTLVGQQQRFVMLSGTRDQLHLTLRSADLAETERERVMSSLKRVESEMSLLEASRASLRRQLEALCAPTQQQEGWLGIGFTGEYTMDVTPNGRLMAVRRPPEIETIEPSSPAEKAGLRRGDVLLSLGGREMVDAVIALSDLLRPGQQVPVRIKRGTDIRSLRVLIEPRPADFRPSCTWEDDVLARALAPAPAPIIVSGQGGVVARRRQQNPFEIGGSQPQRGAVTIADPRVSQGSGFTFVTGTTVRFLAGTQLVPVNDGIAALTGVSRGVFVAQVARRSAAAQSGLVAGDVIVSAEGRAVASPATLVQLMDGSESRELKLQIVRQKKGETVTLKW